MPGPAGYLNIGVGIGCRQRGQHHFGLLERQRVDLRRRSFPASVTSGTNLAGFSGDNAQLCHLGQQPFTVSRRSVRLLPRDQPGEDRSPWCLAKYLSPVTPANRGSTASAARVFAGDRVL